jgi:hypothetical protein
MRGRGSSWRRLLLMLGLYAAAAWQRHAYSETLEWMADFLITARCNSLQYMLAKYN